MEDTPVISLGKCAVRALGDGGGASVAGSRLMSSVVLRRARQRRV